VQETLPNTALHVLSNGAAFKDLDFALNVGGLRHGQLMFGIPLYSDNPADHDFIVQATALSRRQFMD